MTELLDRGQQVRSFDRAPSPLPAHPLLEAVQGDICDSDTVAAAVDGIDTIFHTAAIIDLMGGASVTDEYRQRSFAVNVNGTKNLVHAAQVAGVKRFVYTASNSVVMTAMATKFLETFKEFPPRHEPASFSVDQAVEKLHQFLAKD